MLKIHVDVLPNFRISGLANILIAVLVPAAVVVAVGALRKSPIEIHHGLLAMIAGG